MLRHALVAIIQLYQRTLSPDHGWLKGLYPLGCCRYTPTCSQYALESIARYGAFRGSALALSRVLRCHPWARGGADPVPSRGLGARV